MGVKAFGRIKNLFLDALFPPHIKCVFCDAELSEGGRLDVCKDCFEKLPFTGERFCLRCGAALDNLSQYCQTCKFTERKFDVCRRVFIYEGAIVPALYGLKFGGRLYFAETLAACMADLYRAEECLRADVCVAVPITEKRRKERGYNQAAELARHFSRFGGPPFLDGAMTKIFETKKQAKLSGKERAENLKGAFAVNEKGARLVTFGDWADANNVSNEAADAIDGVDIKDVKNNEINKAEAADFITEYVAGVRAFLKGKRALLVDDIMTTGMTASECAAVLLKAGAVEVAVIAVAGPCGI